jgi:hypothetical protein
MTFDVLTHSLGGKYSPRNVGAIWIESSSGSFVKTLAVWAATRQRYLTKYSAETASNKVDAVTSATLGSHVTHHVTWNMTDSSRNPVPDGAYKVIVEVADQDSTGQFATAPFNKGSPATIAVPDTQYFTAMKITLQ